MPVRRHPIASSKSGDSLDEVQLDQGLIARLEASYKVARQHRLRLAEIFYAKLFAAAPQIRPLFRSDLRTQAEKLMSSLDAIVTNLRNPGANSKMLAELGRRHTSYGAKPEHYDLVIELLVESLGELGGEQLDGVCLEEWRLALRLVSNQMITAAQPPDADPGSSRP